MPMSYLERDVEASQLVFSIEMVKRLNEQIELDLCEVDVISLARFAGYSASHFHELFRNTFACSPHRYILRKRLAHARELLIEGQMSSADVAILMGFFDESHFSRMFKRYFGITPKQAMPIKDKALSS